MTNQKKNKNKNKIVFLWLPVLLFVLIAISLDDDNIHKNSTSTSLNVSSMPSSSRSVASVSTPQNISGVKKITQDTSPFVPSTDPEFIALLDKYDLNNQHDVVRVEDQTWYFSDRYSLVPKYKFNDSMGKVISNDEFYVVAELNNPQMMEKFPPLVVSYNTGSIVPITGDFFIKYENISQATAGINSSTDKDHHRIIQTPILSELSRFQLIPQRKDQIVSVFKKLKSLEGSNSIVHVDFITKYMSKPI